MNRRSWIKSALLVGCLAFIVISAMIDFSPGKQIGFVPVKFNIHETAAVVDLAYSLGVYGFYSGKTMRIGRAEQNWDALCPSDEQ